MTGVSSNQQYQDPAWLSNFLQQHEGEQINVQQGPGGVTITVAGESVFIGPSQMGVLSTFKGHDVVTTGNVNPADPFLMLPETTSFTINKTWVNYYINYISQDTHRDDGFPGLLTMTEPPKSDLILPVPGDLQSQDTETVFKALVSFTKVTTDSGLNPMQQTALWNVLHDMAKTIAENNKANGPSPDLASGNALQIAEYLVSVIPPNTGLNSEYMDLFHEILANAGLAISANEYTSGLTSANKDTVYSSLVAFTDFEKDPILSSAQQTAFTAKLKEIAANIATDTASGKPNPALASYDGQTIGAYLLQNIDISDLSTNDQVLFQNYMSEAAVELGSLNAASGNPPPKSVLMQSMQSTDETKVQIALQAMLTSEGMTKEDIASIQPQLKALAATIAQANDTPNGAGLDITDKATMMAALAQLLGSSNDPANVTLQTALNNMAFVYAAENTLYYSQLSKSTDKDVVFDALVHLSNVMHDPKLTPAQRQASLDYLKAMAAALAFMSKVRAQTSELEAQLRMQENQGKSSTIKDQTKAAIQTSISGLQSLKSQMEQQLHALNMQRLMKIIGPIVIVIMAIISAIIAAFSFGTATAAAVALLAIVIVLIVVATIISIVEMETSFLEASAKSHGINSKAGQDAFAAGIQAIISAIMIVVTFGAGAAVIAAQSATQGIIAAMREAVKQILAQIMTKLQQVIMEIISQAFNILMSSGIMSDGFVAIGKAMGMNESDANTFAMVMTIVMSVGMIVAMAKTAGKSAVETAEKAVERQVSIAIQDATKAAQETAKKAAKELVDDVILETKDSVKDAANKVADVGDATGGAAAAALNTNLKDDVDSVVTAAKKLLARKIAEFQEQLTKDAMLAKIKDPNTLMKLLQDLGAFTQLGATIGQAVGNIQQGQLEEAQALLELAKSQTEALLGYLKNTISTFDMTQKDLDASSKDFLKVYNDLMALFANMVSSASTVVENTTQQG